MRAILTLALLAALSGCATVLPVVHLPNVSSASFVARGTPGTVLDTLEAGLRADPCLSVRRGRDSLGTDALAIEHGCSGAHNRAVLQVTATGDGLVEGRIRSVFVMESAAYVDLPARVLAGLGESSIPAYVRPTVPSADLGCWAYEDWLAWSAEPRPPRPEFTGSVDERAPELVGGIDTFAAAIRYPEEARRNGIEGRTLIRFVVNETGMVTCPEAFVSQSPLLDGAAVTAVRSAQFTPGMQDGRPVKVRFTIPVTFRIR